MYCVCIHISIKQYTFLSNTCLSNCQLELIMVLLLNMAKLVKQTVLQNPTTLVYTHPLFEPGPATWRAKNNQNIKMWTHKFILLANIKITAYQLVNWYASTPFYIKHSGLYFILQPELMSNWLMWYCQVRLQIEQEWILNIQGEINCNALASAFSIDGKYCGETDMIFFSTLRLEKLRHEGKYIEWVG
jgi:hypothetical protein